jgi:thiosulfate reductase cytochrome b subunit
MADAAYVPQLAGTHPNASSATQSAPRHTLLVRVTHWLFAFSFFGLCISGFGILLAHPHFYWGEAGGIGSPTLFSLPLPTKLGGPSGWGRSLHFQSAWFAVLAGSLYIVSGVISGHFRQRLLPARRDLSWRSLGAHVRAHLRLKPSASDETYNVLQRLTYLAVVFLAFPLILFTGFAMSPAITSVFPFFVTVLGGQQTARTLHFVLANLLVLFLVVHVTMISLTGFTRRMRAMITGHAVRRTEGR